MTTHSTNEKAAPLVTEAALRASFNHADYVIDRLFVLVDANMFMALLMLAVIVALLVGGAYGR